MTPTEMVLHRLIKRKEAAEKHKETLYMSYNVQEENKAYFSGQIDGLDYAIRRLNELVEQEKNAE